jgi:hypothetical protein
VPARQVGWVCCCGTRLDDDLRCSCGRRFTPAEGGLVEVVDVGVDALGETVPAGQPARRSDASVSMS